MAENSKIEWTDATWNPVRARRHSHPGGPVTHVGWHCEKVSAGCDNCYAQGINLRLGTKLPFKPGHLAPRGEVEVFLDEKMLLAPLRWKKPRMIFVNSMTDSFGRFVTDEMLDRMFAVMALCQQHTFQVLTKRPERMREYFRETNGWRARIAGLLNEIKPSPSWNGNVYEGWQRLHGRPDGLPNVWLGTSVEDQATADARIPELLATPAAIRFISAEPLLGPVDLEQAWHGESALEGECWGDCAWCEKGFPPLHNCQRGNGDWEKGRSGLDWVIVGGESGPGARPMHPDLVRSLRDQCVAAGVPFFFKQWGEWAPGENVPAEIMGWRADASYGPWVGGDEWLFGETDMGDPESNWDDEADLFRIGKKAAGRLLDGRTWDQMPGVANA